MNQSHKGQPLDSRSPGAEDASSKAEGAWIVPDVEVVSHPRRPLLIAIGLVIALSLLAAQGSPHRPRSDSDVLSKGARAGSGQIRLQNSSGRLADPQEAAQKARALIEQGRSELDTRALGRAQALLSPWWSDPSPPTEIRLLRATILQSLHNFSGALTDLVAVVRAEPRNAQAWLLLTTIHTVRGNYASAREAALQLAPLTGHLTATAAAASVASVNGQLAESYRLLETAYRQERRAEGSIRLWSLTLLGEMADRLGRVADARDHYKRALALGIHDAYLLGAYADHLLANGHPEEVIALLGDTPGPDSLLLRRALAEKRAHPGSATLERLTQSLSLRFEASRARGEGLHQREEARFALELLGQPKRALELAVRNWGVQREPADVKIVLEAALAMGQTPLVTQLQEWLAGSGLEDHSLRRLLDLNAAVR